MFGGGFIDGARARRAPHKLNSLIALNQRGTIGGR
jgi:hypothetical protein